MSIDTISKTDEIVLGLVRDPDSHAFLPGVKPSNPYVDEIRREVESHTTGTELTTLYGMYSSAGRLQRGTLLGTRPTEEAVLDKFYDGFESYFADKYGDASPIG